METSQLRKHWKGLENMYLEAPVNKKIPELELEILEGECIIRQRVMRDQFHAGGGLHGAFYFKLLDDTAYFAAASIEPETFMLTKSFTTNFIRPVGEGILECHGRFIRRTEDGLESGAELFQNGKLVATGKGIFARSKKPLSSINLYGSIIA